MTESNRPPAITDEMLRSYLADDLSGEDMARVEKALRESAEMRARLEDVRQNRGDAQLHTLGAIWRRGRLSCPPRQQLGSYLLDALDPEHANYITFHIQIVECLYCQANLADLQSKSTQHPSAIASRQNRILRSSRHLLGDDRG